MKQYILLFFSIISLAQQTQNVDFTKIEAEVTPNAIEKSVTGKGIYHFKVLSAIDTIRIDAKNMQFTEVTLNNKPINFKNNQKELLLFEGFKKGKNVLSFYYEAQPKQTLYFIGENENLQIWTQGQGKYTSHWLPSFDDVNEKVVFDISVIFRNDFEVVANGVLQNKTINSKGSHYTWQYKMQKPMSSYLVALAIGKFDKTQHISASGTPLLNYYKPIDSPKYASTYKDSDQIFNFLEKEIGYNYPWQIYKQVPIDDFIYAGMENTSLTLFAQDFVVDTTGFNDQNYINVNAHELAHQWFGDLVTAKSGKHHWLQEGFATYYALLAEQNIFGNDYFYYQLYKNAQLLKNAQKKDTIPLLNEKASSLSFYQKGAWALHTIREAIGEKKFKKAVKKYLKKHQFKNVETNDFLTEIKKISSFDVDKFKNEWLETATFQTDEVNLLLKKNAFINQLFEIQSLRNKPFEQKKSLFEQTMKSEAYYPVKVEIIQQIQPILLSDKWDIIKLALQTNNVKVRQAVAQTVTKISPEYKPEFETLLNDDSYETQAIAFEKLCANFPENTQIYLSKIEPNSHKNNDLRIVYLSYVLASKVISNIDNTNLYNELLDFTSSKFDSNTRQSAIETFGQLNPKDDVFIRNLIQATTHFKWRFNQYAKEKLKQIAAIDGVKHILLLLEPTLSEPEKIQIKKYL